MADFPHDEFGLPLIRDYSIATQLDLLRTSQASGHVRQRRQFIHNPSAVQVLFKLRVSKAKQLTDWLTRHRNEWFFMNLISGNDFEQTCAINSHEVKQITNIEVSRIYMTDEFYVGFTVEIRYQANYAFVNDFAQEKVTKVGYNERLNFNSPSTPYTGIKYESFGGIGEYPEIFPLPLQIGFGATIDGRKVSEYTLTYQMNSAMLSQWLAFAASIGTNWFKHRMISPTTPCAKELIRFSSDIDQQLIAPDTWQVTVTAESLPTY